MTVPIDEPGSRASLGELVGEISRDMSTLMRQELDLAKAELRQNATRAGTGVGLLVGAAVAALLVLVFLSIALWWALGRAIGNDLSALVVALLWAVAGVALALTGRAKLRDISGLSETAATVKKIPDAVKGNEEANR